MVTKAAVQVSHSKLNTNQQHVSALVELRTEQILFDTSANIDSAYQSNSLSIPY